MNNLIKHAILAGVATLALGGTALANTYTDIQNPNAQVYNNLFGQQNATGTFNIVSPGSSSYTISGYPSGNGTFTDAGGYVPGTLLSDATATFYLSDSQGVALDKVDIDLGSMSIDENGSGSPVKYDFVVDGNSAVLTTLEANGKLSYDISADWSLFDGGFDVQYALLVADTTTSSGVPDGGTTVTLLGMGLLGMSAVSRKFRS